MFVKLSVFACILIAAGTALGWILSLFIAGLPAFVPCVTAALITGLGLVFLAKSVLQSQTDQIAKAIEGLVQDKRANFADLADLPGVCDAMQKVRKAYTDEKGMLDGILGELPCPFLLVTGRAR